MRGGILCWHNYYDYNGFLSFVITVYVYIYVYVYIHIYICMYIYIMKRRAAIISFCHFHSPYLLWWFFISKPEALWPKPRKFNLKGWPPNRWSPRTLNSESNLKILQNPCRTPREPSPGKWRPKQPFFFGSCKEPMEEPRKAVAQGTQTEGLENPHSFAPKKAPAPRRLASGLWLNVSGMKDQGFLEKRLWKVMSIVMCYQRLQSYLA